MEYKKTNWNETIPISAYRLNKMERGIEKALKLDGGEMTGSLILSGNEPTEENEIVSKKYVEDFIENYINDSIPYSTLPLFNNTNMTK